MYVWPRIKNGLLKKVRKEEGVDTLQAAKPLCTVSNSPWK